MDQNPTVSSDAQQQHQHEQPPAENLPSRQQLMNLVEFVKREYQQLSQELTEKNVRLEQLSRSKGKSSQQQFDLEMQNYELKSQLNKEKMLHMEHIKQMNQQFNQEIDQLQLSLQTKYRQDMDKAEKRIRELQMQLINQAASDSDGQMIAAMKQKMFQTEELLTRLNTDYTNTLERRNKQIILLSNQLEKIKNEYSSSRRSQVQILQEGGDIRQHNSHHIAQLEDKVTQLAQILVEYQNKQHANKIDDSGELYKALEQSQRLNDQLNVQLKECHRRIEQLQVEHDQITEYNSLLNIEQLRIKDDIISAQKLQLDRCMSNNEQLELRLKQFGFQKDRELDEVLRVTVEKFESKISSIRNSQSDKSERRSIEPIQVYSRVNELENEVKQLRQRIADQNMQLEHEGKQKDELILRSRQLQTEIANVIEQLKTHSQTSIPTDLSELERLRLQNNDYKEKFGFLQKQAKRIVDDHRETIQRLEIALQETNHWNKQLKQQENVFKREYQVLLKYKEQLTKRLQAQQNTGSKLIDSGELAQLQRQTNNLKSEKNQLQEKLKEAQDNAQLNSERLELMKVSKKDLEKRLQQYQTRVKEADKKSSAYQNKLKKLNDSNNTYKDQLLHQKEEYRKLAVHYESIKHRHEQEIIGLQKSFDEMNQKLIHQKKSFEDKKAGMISEQAAEFQKLNQNTLKLQNEVNILREQTARCQNEVQLLKKEKKDLFSQVVRLRQDKQQVEQVLEDKDSLLRIKDKCIEEFTNQMQQLKMQQKEINEYSDNSVIIADKDKVYEYIAQLEEKCRLLQGFNTQLRKSVSEDGSLVNFKFNSNTLLSQNADLKNEINRLEREIGEARLETNRISLQLQQYKRRAMEELAIYKREDENVIKRLYSQIDRLNSLIDSRQSATNNLVNNNSLRVPNRAQVPSTRFTSNFDGSSLQSPLSFNTQPGKNLQRQRTLVDIPNNFDHYGARNTNERSSIRQRVGQSYSDINSILNGSNFTAVFGRQS